MLEGARAGSGIGSLLANYSAATQNKQKLDLAKKELMMKDPNRQPGIMDLLGLAGDIYKTQSVYSMFPGMSGSTPNFDASKFQNILQGLQNLQAVLGQQPQAPAPAMPAAAAPAASAAQPQQQPSVLNKYLSNPGQPGAPQAPAQPAVSAPVTVDPVAQTPGTPPVAVNRSGKSYQALWRSKV